MTKQISRRTLIGTAAALGAAPALLTKTAAAQEKVLFVNTWGGTLAAAEDEAFFKPFTKETGIQIRQVSPVSIAKLKAQVLSGQYDWDVSNIDTMEYLQAKHEGLLEPIDFTVLDRSKMAPECVDSHGIQYVATNTNLVYRKDKFPNGGPKNWSDFWDVKKFPGNRSFYNQPHTILAFALVADGVALDKIYPMDLDRAFKKLDQIKPHIKVWWTQGGQSETLIKDGEVDMIAMWGARAQLLIDQGVPLEIVWHGSQVAIGYHYVPKGTPRAKEAWKFIEYTGLPAPQAAFSKRLPYGPSNPKAFEHMTKAEADRQSTNPEHMKVSFVPNYEWTAANLPKIRERFTQWLAA